MFRIWCDQPLRAHVLHCCIPQVKYPIIWAILIYQRVAPTSLRERCLFKKSCSNYVLEGAREKGTFEAFRRLRERIRRCRPGYAPIDTSIAGHNDLFLLKLSDGSFLEEAELSERLKREFNLETQVA
ncbi:membrane protein insertion efficiency factor YidD [Ruegeria arenilitoris]|uniref:membrane protein insertion efficiency factor YidD n=1 Tax=Ruegeria arenilitoris TaxID=1173585 RepID=UPI0034643FF4